MILSNFPNEIIFEIFKKCDYVTCLKLIKVFKKKIYDNKLQIKNIEDENTKEKISQQTYKIKIYLNEIKKQEKMELRLIKSYHRNRFF